eukprot:GHVS01096198.1.p1 GENE.GHVS01096198.1~~GHVS01096198.1.p1  ORF type:complete len:397 (+),score=54.70 GHVS01096198.1:119-1309(+)
MENSKKEKQDNPGELQTSQTEGRRRNEGASTPSGAATELHDKASSTMPENILSVPNISCPEYPSSSMEDPREQIFSTLAGNDEEEEHLLSFDYDSLPTYPLRPCYHTYRPNTPPSPSSPGSSLPPSMQSLSTHINSFNPTTSDPYRPAVLPIYQTATFHQPNIETFGPYDYTRSGNPTRTAVETLVASLELAHAAFAFASGMAAMTAVIRLMENGQEIVCAEDVYGGLFRLLTRLASRQGIKTHFCDVSNLSLVQAAITEKTKMIWVESPSNPLMKITDLRAIACLAHSHNILLVVDSTMMTPCLMRPLCLGADIVVHSATKFFSGHSDTMAGFVCCSTEELSREVAFVQANNHTHTPQMFTTHTPQIYPHTCTDVHYTNTTDIPTDMHRCTATFT